MTGTSGTFIKVADDMRVSVRFKGVTYECLKDPEFTERAQEAFPDLVLRVFAGQIELSPAEYAEAEAGVVRWIGAAQATLIPQVLGLSTVDRKQFLALLAKAQAAKPLEFDDLFTREQLEPVRLRYAKGKQAADRAKQEILDAVFAPLE